MVRSYTAAMFLISQLHSITPFVLKQSQLIRRTTKNNVSTLNEKRDDDPAECISKSIINKQIEWRSHPQSGWVQMYRLDRIIELVVMTTRSRLGGTQ